MIELYLSPDPKRARINLIEALADSYCYSCGGTGIRPGTDPPFWYAPREPDRPCHCLGRVEFEGGEVAYVVQLLAFGVVLVRCAHWPRGFEHYDRARA